MGAMFEISDAVGGELVRRFGRRLRVVSEEDFRFMASAARTYCGVLDIDSEKVAIRGGKRRKVRK